MVVGYGRVSTEAQSALRQEIFLRENGAKKIFLDNCTGLHSDRPELQKMLNFVREGDILIVEAIDRLARNCTDLMNLIRILDSENVIIHFLQQDLKTDTAEGKEIVKFIGQIVEMDTILMKERQRQGIELAKQRGVYQGTKKRPLPSNFTITVETWKRGEITAVEAMKRLNMKPSTFYRRVKEL